MVRPRPQRPSAGKASVPTQAGTAPAWASLPREKLLDVRLCDLGLRIEESPLAPRVQRLFAELERAGLRFRPSIWLSNEWFSPEAVDGFAIPFFLAHRRLARLEARHMLEVEGGDHQWCMKLLRHETAHALDHAYRLHRRKSWREVFGPASLPYRNSYSPDPRSRAFVQHLGAWYAQSHPLEDFAETFAVWLKPGSGWRKHYESWPAREKLAYVDRLMREIRGLPPPVRSRERPDSLSKLRMTLRDHYRRRALTHGRLRPSRLDWRLRRLFQAEVAGPARRTAAAFLLERRSFLRRRTSRSAGVPEYLAEQAIHDLIKRCRGMDLRMTRPPDAVTKQVAPLLAEIARRMLHSRRQEFFR